MKNYNKLHFNNFLDQNIKQNTVSNSIAFVQSKGMVIRSQTAKLT